MRTVVATGKHTSFARLFIWILTICLCALFFTSCSSSRTIVNGLDEREANEILVFLAGKGIKATKIQSTEGTGAGGGAKIALWDIQVDSNDAVEAMSTLNQAGLPRRRGQSLLSIFAGGGLVPSEMQEKIRYQAGLAEQIANTIRKIDGVLDAEVQISFPEDDPLHPGKKQKITAAVYVKHNGVLDDPNSYLINKIKRLVAASVPNLDYDNVTVIGDRIRYSGSPLGPMQSGLSEDEKKLVSVWSINLAQESVTRFQIMFFSFILSILLLAVGMIWLGWKIAPLIQQAGGIRELFHLHPLTVEPKEETVHKESEEEEQKLETKKEKKEEGEGQVDQEIDDT